MHANAVVENFRAARRLNEKLVFVNAKIAFRALGPARQNDCTAGPTDRERKLRR